MNKLIKYAGEELDTVFWCDISDKEFQEIRDDYYRKPDFSLVEKEFKGLYKGNVMHPNITSYYVKDLMAKTKIWYNKWSIEQVFECKDLLAHYVDKVEHNKKVYPDSDSLIKKIETAFRLGGKGIASKPTNFPVKVVDKVLAEYNINNYWYDFSCGWGDRLLGALKNKVNYIGTDPNYLLVDRLKQMVKDYKKVNNLDKGLFQIKAQGSEIFMPEWENKIGLAFSSPPYFYLEDYKIGNQSWKPETTYEQWKENYLRPTIKNIYKYLIPARKFLNQYK